MGPSGVGKTTLLNLIIPGLDNTTASVSSKIKRGKNIQWVEGMRQKVIY